MDQVTGEWRRLHYKALNDLYSSPNIVRVIKWKRMRWAGHVAHMGEEGGYRFLVGKPEGRRPLDTSARAHAPRTHTHTHTNTHTGPQERVKLIFALSR